MMEAPDNPAGPLSPTKPFDRAVKAELIEELKEAVPRLRVAVTGLIDDQLDTRYRNWTVRQITHHLADSHLHSYIRFKWSLTESNPTIKAYEEADWVQLADSSRGDIQPALQLLDALHGKWIQLLETMSADQFTKTFFHPQSKETVDLWSALHYYPWHARHHTGQILWLREQYGW